MIVCENDLNTVIIVALLTLTIDNFQDFEALTIMSFVEY